MNEINSSSPDDIAEFITEIRGFARISNTPAPMQVAANRLESQARRIAELETQVASLKVRAIEANERTRAAEFALNRAEQASPPTNEIRLGNGDKEVDIGHLGDEPCVFITNLDHRGIVGRELPDDEKRKIASRYDWAIICRDDAHAKVIADALCGASPPPKDAQSVYARCVCGHFESEHMPASLSKTRNCQFESCGCRAYEHGSNIIATVSPAPEPKALHDREPPHCPTCDCGQPAEPSGDMVKLIDASCLCADHMCEGCQALLREIGALEVSASRRDEPSGDDEETFRVWRRFGLTDAWLARCLRGQAKVEAASVAPETVATKPIVDLIQVQRSDVDYCLEVLSDEAQQNSDLRSVMRRMRNALAAQPVPETGETNTKGEVIGNNHVGPGAGAGKSLTGKTRGPELSIETSESRK